MREQLDCTYNCCSVSIAAKISALIDGPCIFYEVTKKCERKRKATLSPTWSDDRSIFLGALQAETPSGAVGYVVAPRFVKNIASGTFYNSRFSALITTLAKDIDASIIQVYAPTTFCKEGCRGISTKSSEI